MFGRVQQKDYSLLFSWQRNAQSFRNILNTFRRHFLNLGRAPSSSDSNNVLVAGMLAWDTHSRGNGIVGN